MADRCTVCAHPQVELIDSDLSRGAKSRKLLCSQYGLSEGSIARHKAHRIAGAAEVLAGREKAPQTPQQTRASSMGVHRRIDAILSGSALIQEITTLRRTADRLGAQAEATGDAKTALLAVRELTRLLELQGRLAIEAQQGRASDVSSHPAWLTLASDIMSALTPWPDAAAAVAARMRERLGIVVAVDPGSDVPFPL